ncbi:prophage PssSM-03 [Pseudomonas coronafaciens pv. porri]|uniref:Prophage PssSM-03 n=1 Tax=Pseudomonas coronafaciens pv. porri TaxID=83964 RepID=A0ABR5JJH0_9PSED|nr:MULTISPECIES: hypothetical protein [Pseudomonas syringae group]KAA3529882.1 hypothetical protein DXU85_29675 [Pseudomonas savastanoi]KOP53779.1 prophage PssSM-03 [Pseudomonas coronafaciens pv. porri]RML76489.1 hypothetical protein ALQ90_200137 [Pseudomonas savastanoi pv. savastanoi]
MQNSKAIELKLNYKFFFWTLVIIIALRFIFDGFLFGRGDADEVVIKRELPDGAWLYVTEYFAPATDLNTLRFYISKPLSGNDKEVLKELNKANLFMVTDSAVKDVKIRDTENGVGIEIKGAVYRYFSKQYLTEGETLKSYRITLSQQDTTPRD